MTQGLQEDLCTLWTPWPPSFVIMDFLCLDTTQVFVRLQETGLINCQHVSLVIKLFHRKTFTYITSYSLYTILNFYQFQTDTLFQLPVYTSEPGK